MLRAEPRVTSESSRHELHILNEQLKSVSDTHIFMEVKLDNKRIIDYLKTHTLNNAYLRWFYNRIENIDDHSVKYLFDCYAEGKYDWKQEFYDFSKGIRAECVYHICRYCTHDQIVYVTNIFLAQGLDLYKIYYYVCRYSSEKTINYILDVYLENNLDLGCDHTMENKPIHFICFRGFTSAINRILDYYLEKNYDLECENAHGERPIHCLLYYGDLQIKHRIMDIYIGKNLDFDCVTKHGIKPIHVICKHGDNDLKELIFSLYRKKYGYTRIKLLPLVLGFWISPTEFMRLSA